MKWLFQTTLPAVLALGLLAAAPAQEVIHPGDQISVQVFGQPTLSQNVTVLPDGSVQYPLVGRLPIGGMTVDSATSLVTQRMERYVKHPIVTLSITQLGQPSVLVLGDVKTPGKYQLRVRRAFDRRDRRGGRLDNVNGRYPTRAYRIRGRQSRRSRCSSSYTTGRSRSISRSATATSSTFPVPRRSTSS